MKKPKLDAHAQRCWGAQFTCIDCNTTFEGTAYRAHTSCISEEQRYHKSVYKAPKGKGKNQQQQQQQQQQSKQQTAPAAPAPAVEPTQSSTTTTPAPAPASNKRAREDEPAATTASNEADAGKKNGDVAPAVTNGDAAAAAAGGEPDQKKKKKDKKQKNKDKKEIEAAEESKPAASLSAFLTAVVEPLLQKKAPETSGDVSLAEVRRAVLDAARGKGYEVAEVEERLWQGLKVGGKKGKVRVEF
ncbi:hypothetical protein RHOSPDRAFT_33267 [Rhodotorula sp. JG-1b]|nr:hypothetical protein RHOSPDRAFT_33267 [Rhodotorula sp. JG-1b]